MKHDEEILNSLNMLLAICCDLAIDYQFASKYATEQIHRKTFGDYAHERQIFIRELINMIVSMGGDPSDVPLKKRRMTANHRMQTLLSQQSFMDMLGAYVEKEKDAKSWYDHLLSNGISKSKSNVLTRQSQMITSTVRYLRSLEIAYH